MNPISITESSSVYDDLDKMSIHEILSGMNREDKKVPLAVGKAIPQIETLINVTTSLWRNDGDTRSGGNY